ALASAADGAPELIVIGSFPGKPSFRGLGELTAAELETLWPSRVAGTPGILAQAAPAWGTVGPPRPSPLARPAPARRGGAALRRMLEELPAPGDGLSGTERRALQAIAAGAATPVAALLASQDLETAPFLGDAWFYRTLTGLSRGRARLIETHDGEQLPDP